MVGKFKNGRRVYVDPGQPRGGPLWIFVILLGYLWSLNLLSLFETFIPHVSAFPLSRSQSSFSQGPLHRYVIRLHWTDKPRKVSEEARHGIHLCDCSSTGIQLPEVVLAKVLGSTTLRPGWEGSLHFRESCSSFSPATLSHSGPGICRTKGHTYSQLPHPHPSTSYCENRDPKFPVLMAPGPLAGPVPPFSLGLSFGSGSGYCCVP